MSPLLRRSGGSGWAGNRMTAVWTAIRHLAIGAVEGECLRNQLGEENAVLAAREDGGFAPQGVKELRDLIGAGDVKGQRN